MSGHRPWSEVKAEKARLDAARGRTPITASDPYEGFIYTRGPHVGEPMDPDHDCVPECYTSMHEELKHGRWEDPRPWYRVLANPRYDHDLVTPYHPDGGPHNRDCAAGHELEIHVANPNQPPPLGLWRPIGTTQLSGRGALDAREARAQVIDYVRALAHPVVSGVTADRIELYLEVT